MIPISIPASEVISSVLHGTSASGKLLTPIDQANPNSPQMAKLVKAAQDFESILVNTLWKTMQDASLNPSGLGSEDPASASVNQFGMSFAANAIGHAGGFGIANMIVKALESQIGATAAK
jgi:Rod binding domain-containing protein